jgi:type II restriction enzyme
MLAIHEPEADVILDTDGRYQETSVIFRSPGFTKAQAKILTLFAKQSGLLQHLTRIGNIWDYSFGVEVGIDTNARKGRSGKFGEMLLQPHVVTATKERGLEHSLRTKPSKLLPKSRPRAKSVFDRVFDALICKESKIISIEVNFYNVAGTKLDSIASDYQTRARDCKKAGLTFVWVTDGQGWNSSKGMLGQAIENIDYVFNFELLERGALAKLCDEVFR